MLILGFLCPQNWGRSPCSPWRASAKWRWQRPSKPSPSDDEHQRHLVWSSNYLHPLPGRLASLGIMRAPLKPPNTIMLWWPERFQGVSSIGHDCWKMLSLSNVRLIVVVFQSVLFYCSVNITTAVVIMYLFNKKLYQLFFFFESCFLVRCCCNVFCRSLMSRFFCT